MSQTTPKRWTVLERIKIMRWLFRAKYYANRCPFYASLDNHIMHKKCMLKMKIPYHDLPADGSILCPCYYHGVAKTIAIAKEYLRDHHKK